MAIFTSWYFILEDMGEGGYRNPAWVLGGVEKDGQIEWVQLEILLYHPYLLLQARRFFETIHTLFFQLSYRGQSRNFIQFLE